jgi:hypothetical protein
MFLPDGSAGPADVGGRFRPDLPLMRGMDMGENLGGGLGKAGDLPSLDRVEELFLQTGFGLVHIPAYRRHDRKGVEFFKIVPKKSKDVQAFFGEGTPLGNPLPLRQGASDFFVPILEPDQVTFVVDLNALPGMFDERHLFSSDQIILPQRSQRTQSKKDDT